MPYNELWLFRKSNERRVADCIVRQPDNGVRVVTEHIPYVRSVTLAWFQTGSRMKMPTTMGFHFIEHMVFKGTKTCTAREIAEIIDAAGGHPTYHSGKEHTCFYVRVLDEHLRWAWVVRHVRLLLQRVQMKRKGRRHEEIRMYEDCPDEVVPTR